MDPIGGEKDARAEQFLREAHIQRMRGRWGEAEALVRQALALTPRDAMGLELLGDALLERGEVDEAEASFNAALVEAPGKASLETKIARIVLRRAEDERNRISAELLFTSPRNAKEDRRQQTVAILLSVLCAGGGQLFKGQHLKGGLLLAVWLVSLTGALEAFKLVVGGLGGLPRGEEVNGGMAFFGLIGGLLYLYSILDAAGTTRRSSSAD